jgi:hypothetical protein
MVAGVGEEDKKGATSSRENFPSTKLIVDVFESPKCKGQMKRLITVIASVWPKFVRAFVFFTTKAVRDDLMGVWGNCWKPHLFSFGCI